VDDTHAEHVGTHIRRRVIPPGMSVTDAAKALGVGRPALSKLLNGRASLSSEMALRLERTFGADRQHLLERQATSHRERSIETDRAVAAGRFVPPFLSIKARQIEDWAKTSEARDRLAVLLRTLIHSTGDDLSHVDFPGHDDAQRPGWDGWVESGSATPWIPRGKSGWEFGVSEDARRKATRDYANRLSIPPMERTQCTFVFVTPNRWRDKDKWAMAESAAAEWRAVRAFDASDLEQWLEQSIVGQIWLSEQLGIPTRGCETLDRFWENWRGAAEPRITGKIFATTVESHIAHFRQWLAKPNDRPLYVAADSTGEALAFLACLFRHPDVPTKEGDRAILFKSADSLRALASATSPFIPIACDEATERELAPLYDRFPCIVVRPRNAVDREPDIALELLGEGAFRHALADMGIERDARRLARESGRSPTILRRRLSRIDAIRLPQWAHDRQTAWSLIPLMLAGAWHAKSKADCKVLSDLTGCAYETVEENITHLRQLDDPPVWSVGQYRGVASQIDALFAISPHLTERDIELFLESATTVLSEDDPALQLPVKQREFAGVYGKVRDHSAELRAGICETLILLAVHGNHLVQKRLGIDVATRIARLIREVLSPLTLERLLSCEHDLPLYAEAAPDAFLNALEGDLRQAGPAVRGLLLPAERRWFAAPRRTGLLRALECLAWIPEHFPRVIRILAQLAETNIDDNWWPKPISSLEAILHPWMPQTAASLERRMTALKMLARDFPDVGWQVFVRQLEDRHSDLNHRPRWRDGGSKQIRRASEPEVLALKRSALDVALEWPNPDAETLGDLVEHLARLSDEDQRRVWRRIDDWADESADDKDKARLRERISRSVWSTGRFREGLTPSAKEAARRARDKLLSSDPVIRHGWLFAKPWVAGFDDQAHEDVDEWSKREEQIREIRTEAMAEIWTSHGWDGLVRLLSDSDAPEVVGRYVAHQTSVQSTAVGILRTCLTLGEVSSKKIDGFMRGFIATFNADEQLQLLRSTAMGLCADQATRLFRCVPAGDSKWRLIDEQAPEVSRAYWLTMEPPTHPHSLWLTEGERAELVDRLLKVGRPRAAFHSVGRQVQNVETAQLKRLLLDLATVDKEPTGSYPMDPHDLSDALDTLDERADVSRDEMASLEYLFFEAVGKRDKLHGIPNLEQRIAHDPAFFADLISLVYERDDGEQDPPGARPTDSDQRTFAARKAYALLGRVRRIPGTAGDGTVHSETLHAWCAEVRRRCVGTGRSAVGDVHIGGLLSHAPSDPGRRAPCGPVCAAIERIASPDIERGYVEAVLNARGAHWRGMEDGGDQERALAASYRESALRLSFEYPYVSGILKRIAEEYERQGAWNDSNAVLQKRTFN